MLLKGGAAGGIGTDLPIAGRVYMCTYICVPKEALYFAIKTINKNIDIKTKSKT